MKRATVVVVALGAATLLWSPTVMAQGLADIARQEKARRDAIAEDEKATVYTNDDLRGGGRLTTGSSRPPSPSAAPGGATATGGATAPGSASETPTPDIADVDDAPQSEELWRSRMNQAREAHERAELMTSALQNRVDGLWGQFTAVDDPAQRALIEQQRTEALAELERVQEEAQRLDQEIRDTEEEARRAGVPPGWLR